MIDEPASPQDFAPAGASGTLVEPELPETPGWEQEHAHRSAKRTSWQDGSSLPEGEEHRDRLERAKAPLVEKSLGSLGARKAAIFVLSLEEDVASLVLRNLSDQELKRITAEIASLGVLTNDAVQETLREYRELEGLQSAVQEGGYEQATRLVSRAFSGERARKVLELLTADQRRSAFGFLESVQANVLFACLEEEAPQTIALVLAQLSPPKAAETLEKFSSEIRRDILERIAGLEPAPAEVLEKLEETLRKSISSVRFEEPGESGGLQAAANILRAAGSVSTELLDGLRERRPELAEEISKRLFVFEDLAKLDDRALQTALKEIDTRQLALALKSAGENVKRKVLSNLPRRAADIVREEMDYLGPVRFLEVEEARRSIVETVLKLEQSGQLYISGRGREEDRIVY